MKILTSPEEAALMLVGIRRAEALLANEVRSRANTSQLNSCEMLKVCWRCEVFEVG
jgi:hypothetical protein